MDSKFGYFSQKSELISTTMTSKNKSRKEMTNKYQLLMETIDDMVLILNPGRSLKIESVNDCLLLQHLGDASHNLIGKSFLDIILENDIKRVSKILKKGNESNGPIPEIRLKTLTGELLWAEIKVRRYVDENKNKKIFVTLKDVSRRKFLEGEMKYNEERFKKVTETVPEIRFWKLFSPKKYDEALQSSLDILRKTPQYIYWKDLKLNYQGCNDNYAKLIGIDPESENASDLTINKSDSELLWDDIHIKYKQDREREVIESKKPVFHEIETWVLQNGQKIWIDTNKIPLFDSDGTVIGILVTFEDITERRLADEKRRIADEKLRESEERYRHLVESSPYAILIFNMKGELLDFNSTTEKMFGYKKDEFKGKPYEELPLHPPEIFKLLNKKFRKIMEGERVKPTEFQILKKDGSLAYVTTEIALIKLAEETIFQASVQDITEKKQAEMKLIESELRYRDLLETSTVGIFEIDLPKRNITYVNPKFTEIIGYEEDDLLSEEAINKIVLPEDLEKLFESLDEREIEFRIKSKDSKLKWLKGRRISLLDESGKMKCFRYWVEDVTEKKIYEELIYELNINFLSFSTDIQKNIELLLKTGIKLLNGDLVLYVNKESHEGEEKYQLFASNGESQALEPEKFKELYFINEFFNEEHDFPQTFYDINETKYQKRDPFIKNLHIKGCYGKLIKSNTGLDKIICVLFKENPEITNQDQLVLFLLSDAIEIESRRLQAQKHIQDQVDLKTKLLTRTSHELKTPLISIKGFTELLLKLHSERLDNDIISILEEIKEGSNRLENYINTLVEGLKYDREVVNLNKFEENLSPLIKDWVKQLSGMANLREQQIYLEIDDEIIFSFDNERIYEVFSNLLLNSIKYTPVGGNIKVRSKKEDNYYIISVSDTGIGLTEKEKKQLFKEFGKIERYGQGWDVDIEGTGLGLYISKKIVDLHKGKIWAESEGRNKGSTFSFALPIS